MADLIAQVQPVLQRFRDYKRSAALLDFDDLIFAARDLLRDHDEVRRALAARFSHVLVDEFQDTDPLQTEIFWRLCGDPPAEGATATTGPTSRSVLARCFWSAIPSRRSIASAARTSAPMSERATHSCAGCGQRPVDLDQFPLLRANPAPT